jgi:hypothetical protein
MRGKLRSKSLPLTIYVEHARGFATRQVANLEQVQFLIGHVSIQTTERYLGCKQRIRGAVNDRIGIEPQS